jgi:hypothetical protein
VRPPVAACSSFEHGQAGRSHFAFRIVFPVDRNGLDSNSIIEVGRVFPENQQPHVHLQDGFAAGPRIRERGKTNLVPVSGAMLSEDANSDTPCEI